MQRQTIHCFMNNKMLQTQQLSAYWSKTNALTRIYYLLI